jgi:hypothetical protein
VGDYFEGVVMGSEEYMKLGAAVKAGQERFVRHIVTHRIGKVIACRNGEVDVDCSGTQKIWIKEDCQTTQELQ